MALIARLNVTRQIQQGDLNPVGMIVSSMLTEAQFQALNGTSWVLAYGQSIAGSAYAQITGNSTAPDLRGRVVAGLDNMGGSAANRLTAGGSGIAATTLGAVGGAQTHTLDTSQMPSHAHGVNESPHSHGMAMYGQSIDLNPGSNRFRLQYTNDGGTNISQSFGTSTGISIQNNGSSAAHQNTQPTMVANYFIKIN